MKTENVVLDKPARTAQVDLKRHFTQMSECLFSIFANDTIGNKSLSTQLTGSEPFKHSQILTTFVFVVVGAVHLMTD